MFGRVAVIRDDRSRTRSALIELPEELLFRLMDTCWPTDKSAGMEKTSPVVLTATLSACTKSTSNGVCGATA